MPAERYAVFVGVLLPQERSNYKNSRATDTDKRLADGSLGRQELKHKTESYVKQVERFLLSPFSSY